VTNTSPLLITGFGQPITISGWAKQRITNGYTNKFAYLEQYFDQAHTMDANGNVTSNSAGLLSPYGEFFPMQPGPAALLTMPDIDPPYQRGTGVVNVVKLQLDVNHDGTMDPSFAGPDNTSQTRPFAFWVNNDCDWATYPGSPNFDPGHDKLLTLRYSDEFLKDYLNFNPRSVRDLEDYARLWICGVPALTNGNYQVTLNWANVNGSPAINLLKSVETNGGNLYLTDANIVGTTNIVWRQLDGFIGGHKYQLPTTSTLTLPGAWFTNSDNKYLLFEGAGIGSGELVLTIAQGSNVLAETSTWLDLRDVKDFYERMVVSNSFNGAISNWSSGVQTVQQASASALGDDTNLIVLVHGINVSDADWRTQSDSVFKRLYWSGFHGKFMTVKWPCLRSLQLIDFNASELHGYKSSAATITYLNQLRTRFPGYGLHLLVHSQGNAVVSEALKQGAPFDTYILSQGAIAASAYDVSAPVYPAFTNQEVLHPTPEWQPKGYRGVYTNLTGRIVNFYNTNDFVLGIWQEDQRLLKPNEAFFNGGNYYWDGTNGWHLLEGAPPLLVTDSQESRAMISRSRTLSIGQSGPESGHGVIQSGVELNVRFGFYDTIAEHSAQWTRPIQTSRPYFQEVLRSCQIQPAP